MKILFCKMRNVYLYLHKHQPPIRKHEDHDYLMIYTFYPNKFNKSVLYVNVECDKYAEKGICIQILYTNWIFQSYSTLNYIKAVYAGKHHKDQCKFTILEFYSTIAKYLSKKD